MGHQGTLKHVALQRGPNPARKSAHACRGTQAHAHEDLRTHIDRFMDVGVETEQPKYRSVLLQLMFFYSVQVVRIYVQEKQEKLCVT